MALEVKRKEKEDPQSLVRRFSRRLRRSGILSRARKARYLQREKSSKLKKESALRKLDKKKEYKRKKKLGLL
ncbi:MAG: hypothetical protein GF370_01525 [Candidatus Nealsonbacteria bacterium]|nr:hypothetical protein [Candidatus Nealsonbacteria bacterium]